jgi:hypothetical protein
LFKETMKSVKLLFPSTVVLIVGCSCALQSPQAKRATKCVPSVDYPEIHIKNGYIEYCDMDKLLVIRRQYKNGMVVSSTMDVPAGAIPTN